MEDIWYLQDTVDEKPLWGLFETALLRKQLLNGIAAGLHHKKIIEQCKGQGGYVVALLMEDKLFIFSREYRAYLVTQDGEFWSNDPQQEISVREAKLPRVGILVLSDGDLTIDNGDCTTIKNANPNRNVFCIDLETQQTIPETDTYYIHDNGGRPFKVTVDEQVSIYKQQNDNDQKYSSTALFTFNPQRVFVGKSPLNKMTEFSGGHGSAFDGNSLLLQTDGKYVFVGHMIFEFTPLSDIVEFVSPVGNNDVPYPYAIDEKGNYYLLIEGVILGGDLASSSAGAKPRLGGIDPYNWYYARNLITPDLGRTPPISPIIKNFKKIKEFYVDDDQYTLRYKSHPSADYDRMIPDFGDQMYVVKTDDKKYLLSKDDYIGIMEEFGKRQNFQLLEKNVLQKRLW